jgi:predicted O-linked N-acetylglucosamine transferase (SPINDLY family)
VKQKNQRALESLQQAMAAHQRGDLVEAGRLYKVVLRKIPDHFDALHLLGLVEAQRGRHDKADQLIRHALRVNANAPEVHANLGNVQRELGQLDKALDSYDAALRLKPGGPNALNGRGAVLLTLGKAPEALASFDAALALEPSFVGAHHNRGTALRALRQPQAALGSFEQALALDPHAAALHVERGSVLVELERSEEALAAFARAIALDPTSTDALYNQGVALVQVQRFDDALASFDKAIALAPRFAAALSNRAKVLLELGRTDDALASFERAVEADAGLLSALSDKGYAALAAGRSAIAADAFERLVARDPQYPYALGNLLYARMYGCDWRDFNTLAARVAEGVRAGRRTVIPGHLLAITDAASDQLRAGQIWAQDTLPATPAGRPARRYGHDKIRIAYVSADFHAHATSYLMARLIELHDRARFEITAVSLGPDEPTQMRARMVRAFDHFVDAAEMTNRQVADLLTRREIDIAVDLKGYTQGGRLGLFALRPADVQVAYLGYPGTTGLHALDYIIADRCVIPEDQRGDYSEQVVYLPDTYQVNDSQRAISTSGVARAEAGLPALGFVFCCFNNNYKITPQMFAVWMRLLRALDGSVLWLLQPNAAAVDNLRQAVQAAGVAPERLVFAGRMELDDHLARHRLADLFLDTLPYNAHTTASDALWAGLPVLTCRGGTFPGRVAASLLQAVGLPELVTDTLEAYENLALTLARDPAALATIRAKLASNRGCAPLFDTDRFRRHIEQAYVTMWERHERGEPPASFAVEPVQ